MPDRSHPAPCLHAGTYGKGPCKAQIGNPVVCEQLNEDALCSVGYTDCSEEIGLGNAISECTSTFNAQDSSCAAVVELGHVRNVLSFSE